MKERDIVRKALDTLNGDGSYAWIKIPDSWGGGSQRFTPKKYVDLVKTCDCAEVKIVKAKTTKGLVYRLKNLRPEQYEILKQRNGVLIIGWVLKGKRDKLLAITYRRISDIKGSESWWDAQVTYASDEMRCGV